MGPMIEMTFCLSLSIVHFSLLALQTFSFKSEQKFCYSIWSILNENWILKKIRFLNNSFIDGNRKKKSSLLGRNTFYLFALISDKVGGNDKNIYLIKSWHIPDESLSKHNTEYSKFTWSRLVSLTFKVQNVHINSYRTPAINSKCFQQLPNDITFTRILSKFSTQLDVWRCTRAKDRDLFCWYYFSVNEL